MKVRDIISDEDQHKNIKLAIHLKKKKKNNPVKSRTGLLQRFPDDSYGIAGSGDTGSAGGSII